jgi:hypothetical protein
MPGIRFRLMALTLAACLLNAGTVLADGPMGVRPSVAVPRTVVQPVAPPRVQVTVPRPETTAPGPATQANTNPAATAPPPKAPTNTVATAPPPKAPSNTSNPSTSSQNRGPAASTDNVVGPMIQNIVAAAVVPQSAYVPGPALWNVPSPSTPGPSFGGAGVAGVITTVVAGSLVSNINHYLPEGSALTRDEVAGATIAVTSVVAGAFTLPAGLPAAAIATASTAAVGGASVWIENHVTDYAMGGHDQGVAARGFMNGAAAGTVAAVGAAGAAAIAGATLAVPAATIGLAVGTATAVAYVVRPGIDRAVDGFFDWAVSVID